MGKTALVVSGGGAKGAYAVGVIKHLVQELNVKFDLVAGTSTGGLIAPFVIADKVDLLEELYSNVSTDDVLGKREGIFNVLRSTALFRTTPLAQLIKKHLTEEMFNQIMNGIPDLVGDRVKREMFITTVNLQNERTVYFHNSDNPSFPRDRESELIQFDNLETMQRAVLATASIPFYMPPVTIPRGSNQQYSDGGVRDVAPLSIAIENGATEIYSIVLTPVQRSVREKKVNNLVGVLERTVDLFSSEVLLNDINEGKKISSATRYIAALKERLRDRLGLSDDQVKEFMRIEDAGLADPNPYEKAKPVRIHMIRPQTSDEVPGGTLDFVPSRMRAMIAAGYLRAQTVFSDRGDGTAAPMIAP